MWKTIKHYLTPFFFLRKKFIRIKDTRLVVYSKHEYNMRCMKDLRVRCESLLHDVRIVLCVKCKLCCFGFPVFRHKRTTRWDLRLQTTIAGRSDFDDIFRFGGFVLRVRVMTNNNDYWKINRPWGAFAFHSNSFVMLFHGKFVSSVNDNFSVSYHHSVYYKIVDQVPCSTYNLYRFIHLQNIFFYYYYFFF